MMFRKFRVLNIRIKKYFLLSSVSEFLSSIIKFNEVFEIRQPIKVEIIFLF